MLKNTVEHRSGDYDTRTCSPTRPGLKAPATLSAALLLFLLGSPAAPDNRSDPRRRSPLDGAEVAMSTKSLTSCEPHFELAAGSKRLELEVWQKNRRVDLCNDRWVLSSAPFVLKVRGNAGSASYWATPKKSELKKLTKLEQKKSPLVTGKGFAVAITGMEMQRRYRKLELSPATSRWFAKHWVGDRYGKTAAGSRDYAAWLKRKLGKIPYFFHSGRVYFPCTPKKKLKSYHLKSFVRLPNKKGVEGELPVSTISGKPISAYSKLHLAVFLQEELGRAGMSKLTWKRVDLVFR